MKIFLVHENIDLGYHAIATYTDEEKAKNEVQYLNNKTRDKWIEHELKYNEKYQGIPEDYSWIQACEEYENLVPYGNHDYHSIELYGELKL